MSHKHFISSVLFFFLTFMHSFTHAAAPKYDISFEVPIVIAADRGNLYEVKRLIRTGTNINKQDNFGVTALMRAVVKGNGQVVKELLDAGADVHIKDLGGATALHLATRSGNNTITEMLLKYGANPNATDTQGYSPLERAIKNDKAGIVQSFIKEGADLNKKGKDGLTPAELAFQGSNKKIQQIFNETEPVVAKTPIVVQTPLLEEKELYQQKTNDDFISPAPHEEVVIKEITENPVSEPQPVTKPIIQQSPKIEAAKKPVKTQTQTNVLGVLRTDSEKNISHTKKPTKSKEKPAATAEEIKALTQLEEPSPQVVEPEVKQIAEQNATSQQQSFNFLAWFTSLGSTLSTNEPLENDASFTVADHEEPVDSNLINQDEVKETETEKEIIIAQDIVAPLVQLPDLKPAKEHTHKHISNPVLATNSSTDKEPEQPKDKPTKLSLGVIAREVPDDFQLSSQVNKLTVPTSFHIEVGPFKTSYEAKRYVKSKLSSQLSNVEIVEFGKGYKILIRGLGQSKANELCSALGSAKSKVKCAALSKLNTVSDSLFGLY